jgi:DNA-binding LytR/AlgR family response regulator
MKNLEVFINPASGLYAIYIIARSGHKVVDLDRIIMCTADRNYTEIVLDSGLKIVIPKSICVLESILNKYNFSRCNSSYLINLKKAGSFNRYSRKINISEYEISVAIKRCSKVFPLLTAFGFKEKIRHIE